MSTMARQLVWDVPTRLFHWLFAAGFTAAAVVAFLVGDDSPLFPYHAVIGLVLALLVSLRVVWGLVGSRYARFSSFAYGPQAVVGYMYDMLQRGTRRYVGHNPGSAYAIFAMLALMGGIAVTGIMLGRGDETVKEIHEVLAYAMVAVVIAHVLGVALHMVRHRDNIVASMVHGRKAADPAAAIPSSHPTAAVVLLIVIGAWSIGLVRNLDPATQTTTLPIIGTVLQLGEAEGGSGHERGGAEREDDD